MSGTLGGSGNSLKALFWRPAIEKLYIGDDICVTVVRLGVQDRNSGTTHLLAFSSTRCGSGSCPTSSSSTTAPKRSPGRSPAGEIRPSEELGITKERVRQIESRAQEKLRNPWRTRVSHEKRKRRSPRKQ
jgi:hypothetical protein